METTLETNHAISSQNWQELSQAARGIKWSLNSSDSDCSNAHVNQDHSGQNDMAQCQENRKTV